MQRAIARCQPVFMSFTVAITGRPNVGKSTFFNRLLEQRKAIVDDMSGVTRDRQYGVAEWIGKTFNVIDTGGFVSNSDDVFEREIRKQVHIAIEEANAIIFMVDAATGISNLDESMSEMLRRSTKPVFLVVNKVDNHTRQMEAADPVASGRSGIRALQRTQAQRAGRHQHDADQVSARAGRIRHGHPQAIQRGSPTGGVFAHRARQKAAPGTGRAVRLGPRTTGF